MAGLLGVPWETWQNDALGLTAVESMALAYRLSGTTQKDQQRILSELEGILVTGKPGTIRVERTDGHTWIANCAPIQRGGYVVTFEDVTELRKFQDQIAHMAHFDALTDLPNRRSFEERIEHLLVSGEAFAMLSLDLDRFKKVNDELGHPVGDRLLQQVAERLRRCLREGDLVARLGGDEFAMLQAPCLHLDEAISLAKRVIETASAPYQIDDHPVTIGVSVGIVRAPDHGRSAETLTKNADLALYRCKAAGGNTHFVFNASANQAEESKRQGEVIPRQFQFAS
jgi:diguanylate cyclase (GGDEF)-like protein